MICRATYQWSAQIALPMVHNVHVVYCFKIWLITGQTFCESHCVRVAELGYPTDLKKFLKSCGNENQTVNPNEYSKPMKQRVDKELKKISKMLEGSSPNIKTASEAQGTSYLLRNKAFRNKNNFVLEGDGEDCNKLIISLKETNVMIKQLQRHGYNNET